MKRIHRTLLFGILVVFLTVLRIPVAAAPKFTGSPQVQLIHPKDFEIQFGGWAGPQPEAVLKLPSGTLSPGEPDIEGIRALYPGDRARVIVQFDGPIMPEWTQQLESMGAVVETYIPDNALLITVPSDLVSELLSVEHVRRIGPFRPEYKMTQRTAQRLSASTGPVMMLVKGFAADSPEDLRRAVESLGGRVVRELPMNGAFVVLPADRAGDLASSAYVLSMDLVEPKAPVAPVQIQGEAAPPANAQPENYWAGQVTGSYWINLLWGITGAGVTVAVGDTGLDTGDTAGVDDDGDGLVDEDPVEPGCWINNDGDYLINEDDPDDDGDGLVDEDPVNGLDDDWDGYVDEDPVAGLDEDGDGLVDEDPIDGADNDGDGYVDEDPAGIDNDWDGLIDEDPVETAPPCADNDGDGLINEDPAGIDNDGDGLINEDPYDDDMDGRLNEDPPNYGDNDGDTLVDEDGMSDDAACGLLDLDGDGFWYMDDDDGDGLYDEELPNGIDDDGDGLVDEDVPGCDNDGDGYFDEDPAPGEDDDGDGLVDEDPIPWHDYFGTGLPFFTGDDDNDGSFDEDPVDGIDNDGDGLVDEDPAGIDNDGDGLVDEDTEIWPDFVGKVRALIDATEWWEYTGDGSAEDFWFHGTHVSESALGLGTSMWGKYGGAGAMYYWPPIPGVAPGADLAMVRFFGDTGYPYAWDVNYNYIDEWAAYAIAHRATGSIITSNSWGYPSEGEYSLYEAYWDLFVKGGEDWDGDGTPEPPITCVFAAGNAGPDPTVSLDGPGIAKNVIQVGATTNPPFFAPYQFADFSSRGPTADGRIKPDVVAPGYYVVGPITGMFMYGRLTPDPVQALHAWAAGTSMATPQVAGAAALWQDLFSFAGTISPSAVKALIVNFADWMGLDPTADSDGNGNPDLYDMGFGQLDFYDILTHPGLLYLCDECVSISTGYVAYLSFEVTDPSTPLEVTLAWSDAPQWVPGVPALVNDFDLYVVAPDGTIYHGNDLVPPYDDEVDRVNNVERVIIDSPEVGRYQIRIYAINTPSEDPSFSLVIFGSGSIGTLDVSAVGGIYQPSSLAAAAAVAAFVSAASAALVVYHRRRR